MCGIAGILEPGGPDRDLLRSMCEAVRHRGPDSSGYHLDGDIGFAMRRLAIQDVAGGDQPIFNEDGSVVIVFNGEIYNFQELRRRLEGMGHQFATRTDTECVVHLYEEYGANCVQSLRGMFAFALYDARRRRLLLARDRVGKKPLYYRFANGGLAFASELKSLIQDPSFDRALDPVALHHFLTYQYVPAPWSILKGIQKLPPAHVLTFENGRAEIHRYWRLDFSPSPPLSEADAAEALRHQILEATRIRLVSERPVGAFLSGGVDSSVVVAAMAQQTTGSVKTFSIGFSDPRYDERPYARLVAERYGTDHTEYVVEGDALDILPTLVWHYDEPFGDSSAIPSFYIAQLTRRHVTVALNGDGGDESFGGYRRYLGNLLAAHMGVPAPLRPAVVRLSDALWPRFPAQSLASRGARYLRVMAESPSHKYARMVSRFDPQEKWALYTGAMREATAGQDSWALIDQAYAESTAADLVNQTLDVDVRTYLPGDLLAKIDIACMANSLEPRSPLLDHQLMEFAAGLPSSFKVRGRTTKYLLKLAAQPWLPHDVIHRSKKGFAVPIDAWLRGPLKGLAWDMLTDTTAQGRGLLEPVAIRRLLQSHTDGQNRGHQIWALLQLEMWNRMFIDERQMSAPPATPQCAL